MDFNYSQDQLAIKEVADRMFRDLGGDEQIKQCYKEARPFHKELWQQLANAGLLGACLPAEFGGSEMGMTELGIVIEAQGRAVAPVPLIETVVACAMPIAQFAKTELKQRILPGVVSGELILTQARPYSGLQNRQPVTAIANGDSWILNGESALALYAPAADGFLVTAKLAQGGHWVGFCDAQVNGVNVVAQKSSSNEQAGLVKFHNVQISPDNTIAVGAEADQLIEWQLQRTYAALAAQQVGVLKEGIRRAADYTNERKQFNRSLSSFQAVAQQAADAYMAVEALQGVYWRALDDIDHNGPSALSSRVAKFWICESG
ncbi:MAG TPA: acyl-CoA dehydrogenase family protein, partial [Pseudomonadales bacterium]|nr:acyl-CoA dehydrogenase family protein [Pseudomonadales bacterium]